MKIGIDATIIDTKKPSGMAFYAINVIREVARLHEDLVVWVIEDDLLDIPQHQKRPVLQVFKGRKKLLPWARAFWTQFILPGLLLKEGADVFFSPIPEGMLNPPVPQILVVHDLVPLVWQEDSPFLRRISFRTRVPLALKAASHVVSVSFSTKKDLLRLFSIDEKKISVAYEGYDAGHFKKIAKDKVRAVLRKYGLTYRSYFLFVGNFTPRKNILAIVEAFNCVAKLINDVSLVLVGNMDFNKVYAGYVISKVKDLELDSRVFFLDYISWEDLPYLYSGAIALVFPSLYEGFGLPVLEAMACGIPIVISDISSFSEVSGTSALYVRNNDSSAIGSKVLELLVNRKLMYSYLNKARIRSKSFSWEKSALGIMSALRSF